MTGNVIFNIYHLFGNLLELITAQDDSWISDDVT